MNKIKPIVQKEIVNLDSVFNITNKYNLIDNNLFNDIETVEFDINDDGINKEYAFKSSNGKVSLSKYITNYYLKNKSMQNFAITDKYIYFSTSANDTWAKSQEELDESLDGNNTIFKQLIVRMDHDGKNEKEMYLDYAGHAQSFDVKNNGIKDVIVTNAMPYIYESKDRKEEGKKPIGSKYRGISITSFKENGGVRVPGQSIAINRENDNMYTNTISSQSFMNAGKLDKETYYYEIEKMGNDENYIENPEIALDDNNNNIAIISKRKVYICDLNELKSGNITIKKMFAINTKKQGVELNNNYLYIWTGDPDKTFQLSKYNIETGKEENKIEFNFNDYKEYYKDRTHIEAEGLSFYNGNLYLGITSRNKEGTKNYNDILKVEGFI